MRLRREDGASAVEFALVAPLLFMLVFGIIGFGLAFLQVQSIRTAVREGGRYEHRAVDDGQCVFRVDPLRAERQRAGVARSVHSEQHRHERERQLQHREPSGGWCRRSDPTASGHRDEPRDLRVVPVRGVT
jgi:hypothetical protein